MTRAEKPCAVYTHPHPTASGLRCRCPGFCKHCGFTESEHQSHRHAWSPGETFERLPGRQFGQTMWLCSGCPETVLLEQGLTPGVHSGKATATEIADRVYANAERRQGMTRHQLDETLDRLVNQGMLVRHENGTYSPTLKGRNTVEVNKPERLN